MIEPIKSSHTIYRFLISLGWLLAGIGLSVVILIINGTFSSAHIGYSIIIGTIYVLLILLLFGAIRVWRIGEVVAAQRIDRVLIERPRRGYLAKYYNCLLSKHGKFDREGITVGHSFATEVEPKRAR